MNNIWFTADHHFDHANIIKYCNRPFSSVEEMDEIMIQRWNEVIKPDDVVYYLGDFTLKNFDGFILFYHRLNGRIFFIPGSHDHRWVNNAEVLRYCTIKEPMYTHEFAFAGSPVFRFVLCHYALRVWDRSHYGSFHLYGHSHGKLPGLGRSMDVGVDTNNFYPYNLDEIVERLNKIEPHNEPFVY